MKIENILKKRIKTITLMTGEYPKEIEISLKEYKQINLDKFEGVKLKIRS